MASVQPLFVADADTLRASLRLSALNSANPSDAVVLVDDAMREVRVGFNNRLGLKRVTDLVALSYDPTAGAPATADENLREMANLCEILWVKKLLLSRLPVTFRDSAGQTRLDWNTDASREIAEADRQAEIDRLSAQIEDYLALLSGDSDEPNSWKATTFGPDNPPRPEETIFGPGRTLGRFD